jgi:hypothetical protein
VSKHSGDHGRPSQKIRSKPRREARFHVKQSERHMVMHCGCGAPVKVPTGRRPQKVICASCWWQPSLL